MSLKTILLSYPELSLKVSCLLYSVMIAMAADNVGLAGGEAQAEKGMLQRVTQTSWV